MEKHEEELLVIDLMSDGIKYGCILAAAILCLSAAVVFCAEGARYSLMFVCALMGVGASIGFCVNLLNDWIMTCIIAVRAADEDDDDEEV